MKCKILLPLFIIICCTAVQAQVAPKRELRAAWITSIYNLDWPLNAASTPAQEQAEFIQRIDEHKATGMNSVFVQVRSQCDAMYPSPFEPWSSYLTGTQGVAPTPFYDPLAFMITETRKKGMEFHAWFNPYRAAANATSLPGFAASHIAKTNPTWILTATGVNSPFTQQLILNPGAPEVVDYVIQVVMDVVRRYDVDGIHFDDYFYPQNTTFNDDSVYNIHNRGIANRADWRRANIDTLMKRLNDSIHSVKPWVKFGVSPTGIWLSLANDAVNGSNTSAGATQHYRDLFANSRKWIQSNWLDYLAPQNYWFIGQTGSDYSILTPWWNNNAFGRHIYMGMAAYKVGATGENAAFLTDRTQIPRQVRLNRSNANVHGSIYYNTASLRNNRLNFRDSLRLNYYNKPALLPAMAWLDNVAPAAPSNLNGFFGGGISNTLTWSNNQPNNGELNRVRQYAIYRSEITPVDVSDINNFLAITNTDSTSFIDNTIEGNKVYYYSVTALDRLHNESSASNTASIIVGSLPVLLQQFSVVKQGANTAQLQWTTKDEINFSHFEVERSINSKAFEKMAIIPSKSQAGENKYSFQDILQGATGNILYRLKMVDKDGSFVYSSIRNIRMDEENGVFVYPTKASKGSKINVQIAATNITGNYQFVNAAGSVVSAGKLAVDGQLQTIVAPENAGMYFLVIWVNGEQKTTTIMVE